MGKIMRLCVLAVSLMSLFGVMSSSAGAVTWVNDGGTHFTATAGPQTFSGGGLSHICSSLDATGTVASGPFVGAIWSAASGTAQFTGCNFLGSATRIHCRYTLTVVNQTLPVTNSSMDMTCDMTQGATKICHIHGAWAAHYVNPPNARLILTHSNTLRTTDAVGSCPLGNGAQMTLTQNTWTLTSANPPIITRRP